MKKITIIVKEDDDLVKYLCNNTNYSKNKIKSLLKYKKIYVKEGDKISQGQKIGETGSTGNVTGPHLHFEIRVNGSAVNPQKHIGY